MNPQTYFLKSLEPKTESAYLTQILEGSQKRPPCQAFFPKGLVSCPQTIALVVPSCAIFAPSCLPHAGIVCTPFRMAPPSRDVPRTS